MAGDHNEFRWGLFVSAVAIAVAAAAGAVGATNPNSKWVTPLWVVSALSVLGAVAVLTWTLIRRFAGPDSTSGPEAESDAKLMLRILEFLEANLELTKQQLEDRTKAAASVVERAVSGLEAEGKVSVHGDRVTRREIIYDERGRVAGEEIVHKSGRRDATAFPETVRAVANSVGLLGLPRSGTLNSHSRHPRMPS